jgi:Ca-activated chloride channel family protein
VTVFLGILALIALAGLLWRRHGTAQRWVAADLCALTATLLLLCATVLPERQQAPRNASGPALALAVDVSASMGCPDGAGNRLDTARRELRALVTGLPGAEFALIPFAGEATVQVPLSGDREALLFFIDHLAPGMVAAPGSAPEEAVLVASSTLAGSTRPQAVLLISDGERTLPGRPPDIPGGIPVHTVAIGGTAAVPVPERGPEAFSSPDPERLRRLATASSGSWLNAGEEPAVTPLLQRWAATPDSGDAGASTLLAAAALALLVLRQLPQRRRGLAAAALACTLLAGSACGPQAAAPGEELFARASALYRNGATEEAHATFAAAARLLDGAARGAALCNQGTLLLSKGNAQQALPLLEEALLLRPGDEAVRTNFVLALRAVGSDAISGLGEGEGDAGEEGSGRGMNRAQALQLLESVRLEPGGATAETGRVRERRIERDW